MPNRVQYASLQLLEVRYHCSIAECECINCSNLDDKKEEESKEIPTDYRTIEEDICSKERDNIAEDMEDWIDEFTTAEPHYRDIDRDI